LWPVLFLVTVGRNDCEWGRRHCAPRLFWLALDPFHKTWRHLVGHDHHAQDPIVGIHPTDKCARGIDRGVPFPYGRQACRRSLTHDGAESEERARVGRLRVCVLDDQFAIWRCHRHGWRHGFPLVMSVPSTAMTSDNASTPTIRTRDRWEMYRKGQGRFANDHVSVAGAQGKSFLGGAFESRRPWAVSGCSPSTSLHPALWRRAGVQSGTAELRLSRLFCAS